ALAWFLATCPDPQSRNPARAIAIATALLDKTPPRARFVRALGRGAIGAAHYAAGDYPAARGALEEALALGNARSTCHRLLLPMGCWQVGEKEMARAQYRQATSSSGNRTGLAELRDAVQRRLEIEAAERLGLREGDRDAGKVEPGSSVP